MNKVNKILSYLPIVIICYWFVCLFITATDFYFYNHKLLDRIDDYIVLFALSHILIFYNSYTRTTAFWFVNLAYIVFLKYSFYKESIDYDVYIKSYVASVVVSVILIIEEKLNK